MPYQTALVGCIRDPTTLFLIHHFSLNYCLGHQIGCPNRSLIPLKRGQPTRGALQEHTKRMHYRGHSTFLPKDSHPGQACTTKPRYVRMYYKEMLRGNTTEMHYQSNLRWTQDALPRLDYQRSKAQPPVVREGSPSYAGPGE